MMPVLVEVAGEGHGGGVLCGGTLTLADGAALPLLVGTVGKVACNVRPAECHVGGAALVALDKTMLCIQSSTRVFLYLE